MKYLPPHSLDAEQAVLGAVLVDASAFAEIADRLSAQAFYHADNRAIWEACQALDDAGQPIDLTTVITRVPETVRATVGQLAMNAGSSGNIAHYAEIVREHWLRRQNLEAGLEIAKKAADCKDAAEVSEFAQSRILGIGQAGSGGLQAISVHIPAWLDELDRRSQSESAIVGLPTGFADFDRRTSGLGEGDLVIVAGRPAMGKTTFAMNIAEHAALDLGLPVAVFSMEMPASQLISRAVASRARVQLARIKSGKLWDEEWAQVAQASSLINQAPLYIDTTPALNPADMRARARRIKQRHGLGLIVVDYLQLMQIPGRKGNRNDEITEISRSLKGMGMSLGVPVIALSQLNRSLEQRPNKRPVMSDLRESGAIEQDADIITFIYRDEVYHEDSPHKGMAEIIIGKQRNGPIGKVLLTFLGEISRFENCADEVQAAYWEARTDTSTAKPAAEFEEL